MSETWEIAKSRGNEAYKAGHFEDAIAAWSEALEKVPDDLPGGPTPPPPPPTLPQEVGSKSASDAEAAALAKAALAGDYAGVQRLLTPSGADPAGAPAAAATPADRVRSVLLANRAQARAQLRDPVKRK